MEIFDTIAAIATPPGVGGVAIVKISGEDSEKIAQKIVRLKSKKKLSDVASRKLALGNIVKFSDENCVLDEVLVSAMRAPMSYTGENVVEINTHGGFFVANVILDEVLKAGARLAKPGEFTRRAYLNGKIDLASAESILDIINSESVESLENANNLSRKLSQKIENLRKIVLALTSNISANLDFPDEIEEIQNNVILEKLKLIKSEIEKLVETYKTGNILKNGVSLVIVGRPNVGKSSILNALLGYDRAIVTNVTGTTRDILEDKININGLILRILDTAGIHNSDDKVEKIGINRAIESIDLANLVLFVLDASTGILPEDLEILAKIRQNKIIFAINKTDLCNYNVADFSEKLNCPVDSFILTSVPQSGKNIGISELKQKIYSKFISSKIDINKIYITSERQNEILIRTLNSINLAIFDAKNSATQDILYIDLEEIVKNLAEITGAGVQDEVIDKVFENFCVGK